MLPKYVLPANRLCPAKRPSPGESRGAIDADNYGGANDPGANEPGAAVVPTLLAAPRLGTEACVPAE